MKYIFKKTVSKNVTKDTSYLQSFKTYHHNMLSSFSCQSFCQCGHLVFQKVGTSFWKEILHMQIVWVAEVINSFKHASQNESRNCTTFFFFSRKHITQLLKQKSIKVRDGKWGLEVESQTKQLLMKLYWFPKFPSLNFWNFCCKH